MVSIATGTAQTVRVAAGDRKVYSVAQVVRALDKAVRDRAPDSLWVRGEVSRWKPSKGGHYFFCLKDDQAEMECVLWRDTARLLPALPADGMEVELCGRVGMYVQKGQFRLEVQQIDSTGIGGLWHVQRERLLEQLRRDGLLELERKRTLPRFPECVGIVTSMRGSVVLDMHRVLRRKAWWIPIRVADCNVEGPGSAPAIAAAIRRFGRRGGPCPVDLVIVARGGGSPESLWGFNLEPVARAIADCPVPVISAVGHETDYTVADEVADVRAATPTAGAERAVPDGRDIAERIVGFAGEGRRHIERVAVRRADHLAASDDAARRAMARRLELLERSLLATNDYVQAQSPRQTLQRAEERAELAFGGLHAGIRQRLQEAERGLEAETAAIHDDLARHLSASEWSLAAAAEGLDARSPLRILGRGFAMVTDPADGRVVRSVAGIDPGRPLEIRLNDGTIAVRATAATPDPTPQPELDA